MTRRITFLPYAFALACHSTPNTLQIAGTVEIRELRIASLTTGRVARLLKDEGDTVRRGDTIAILEQPGLVAQLEQRRAQAQAAQRRTAEVLAAVADSNRAANDLARAISALGEELAADQTGQNCPDFRVRVEGTSRDLAPLVRDEVHRITGEALRNAFRHAQASRIEVEIHYDNTRFRLRVWDNGKGIDPKVLAEGGRTGHYGMPGMQERAKLVGGKLAIWSELDSGTETELTIPASLAYAKPSVARRSMFSGKGTG